jgi:hypothetical protein
VDLTGVNVRPAVETPLQVTEWFDVDALLPNQYVGVQAATTSGSFVHAFAPAQLIMRGSDDWNQIKQRFDLCCLLNFLSPEQTASLVQTAQGFFTASEEGRLVAAMHSNLPCFSEQSVELHTTNTSENTAFPLPAAVIAALDGLNAGVTPPHSEALRLAKSWAASLYREIKSQEKMWIAPHLTVQDGGDVVFEWWQGQKSLSVFVSVDEAWFLQSAGSNSEQTEGDADTGEVRQSIWQWLTR